VLTARERDVCRLVSGGATNREVAAALHMSPRTVEHHLRMAYRKLGVRSRTEMTGYFSQAASTPSSTSNPAWSEGQTPRTGR
jgi:DNA-binding CsgD family transcriptional regulator